MADLKKGEMIEDGNTAPVTAPAPTTPPAALTTTPASPVAIPGVDPSQWITTVSPTPGPTATTPLPTPEKTYAMNPKEKEATDDLRNMAYYFRELADKGELVGSEGQKLPMYSKEEIAKLTPAQLYALMQGTPGYATQYFKSIGKPGGGIGMYGGAGESGQVILPGGGGKEAPKAETKKDETTPTPPIPTPAPTAKETQDPDFWGKMGKIAETLGTGILGAYQAYMAGYAGLTDPNAYFYQTQRQEKIRKETEAEAKAKEEREREWQKEMLAVEQKYRLETARIDQEFQERLQASRTAAEAKEAALNREQQMAIANKGFAIDREKLAADRAEAGLATDPNDPYAAMLAGNLALPEGTATASGTTSAVLPTAATAMTAATVPPVSPTSTTIPMTEVEKRAAAYRAARGN